MTSCFRTAPLAILLLLHSAFASRARGQDFDEPAGAKPAAKTTPAAAELLDPVVRVILEANPTTPLELVQSAQVLTDLDQPDIARSLLEKALAGKPTAEQWTALAVKLGTATLMQLAHDTRLAPLGTEIADAALSASAAYHRDRGRLSQWTRQLDDSTAAARAEAAAALLRAGAWGVPPVIEAAARGSAGAKAFSEQTELDQAPLLALLEAPDEAIQVAAARALARSGGRTAAAILLGPALRNGSAFDQEAANTVKQLNGHLPTRGEARAMLQSMIDAALAVGRSVEHDPAEETVWRMDASAKPETVRVADAQWQRAERLSQSLHALVPTDARVAIRTEAVRLESLKRRAGFAHPLPAGATAGSLAEPVDVLAYALDRRWSGAAAAAAEILRARRLEATESKQPSQLPSNPLVAALSYADRRVRLPALLAVLESQPSLSFAGASGVANALEYFASSAGRRKALVLCPRTVDSSRLTGLLATAGYEGQVATSGRELLKLAARPDCELIFLHVTLAAPTAETLLVQLGRDPRTSLLPVGLIVQPLAPEAAERMAAWAVERGGRVAAQGMPDDVDGAKAAVARLEALADRDRTTPEERLAQAQLALGHIALLAEEPATRALVQPLTETLEEALRVPSLAPQAMTALASLDSREGQVRLVEMANNGARPLPLREGAAAAFRLNVARYGLRLDRERQSQQYDRYNASEREEPGVQALLGSILDAIEDKDTTRLQ